MSTRKSNKRNKQTTSTRIHNQPNLVIPRPLMPHTTVVTLNYTDSCSLNPATSTPANFVFRANDCYDPNYTSTGHQPIGFDQMSLFYSRFCVLRSRIFVTFCPKSTTDTVATFAGVLTTATSTLGSSIYEIMEQPTGTYISFRGLSTYGGPRTISTSLSVSKFTGVKSPEMNSNLSSVTTSSPSEPIYYVVWASAEDESDSAAMDAQVRIEYTVHFSRLKYLSGSWGGCPRDRGASIPGARSILILQKHCVQA